MVVVGSLALCGCIIFAISAHAGRIIISKRVFLHATLILLNLWLLLGSIAVGIYAGIFTTGNQSAVILVFAILPPCLVAMCSLLGMFSLVKKSRKLLRAHIAFNCLNFLILLAAALILLLSQEAAKTAVLTSKDNDRISQYIQWLGANRARTLKDVALIVEYEMGVLGLTAVAFATMQLLVCYASIYLIEVKNKYKLAQIELENSDGTLHRHTIKVDTHGNALDLDGDGIIDENDEIQENETCYQGFNWATEKTPKNTQKDDGAREAQEVYI